MIENDLIFDNEAVRVEYQHGSVPVLVVCEHASNAMPEEFQNLGLSADVRQSHIAWDPGALPVAQTLAKTLGGVLIAGAASRLLFDCNRPPEAVDAMPSRSEIFDIPGNRDLSDAARAERVRRFHDPFNTAMNNLLEQRDFELMVTIHSFTPTYNGKKRAVEIGVLHDQDSRFADSMLASAGKHTQMLVRRNDPYGPEHGVTHTLVKHAQPRQMLNVMIELRNDLLTSPARQQAMAHMLTAWIAEAMSDCGIHHPQGGV